MKMKTRKILKGMMILGTMTMMVTGCGNQIPDLTEEQAQKIGEYAALTLLKYDTNHQSRLVDEAVVEEYEEKLEEEALKESAEPTPTPEPEGMDPVADTPVVEREEDAVVSEVIVTMEECLGLPGGVAVTYEGRETYETYPADGSTQNYFTLDASAGKKLLVLNFSLENQTGSDVQIDLFAKDAVFMLSADGVDAQKALTTMLLNDLSTYVGAIEAENSREMVLLFEIDEMTAENLTDIKLQYKNESNVYTIQLF